MISWDDINLLQKQKNNLQLELDEFLNSDNKKKDSIDKLKNKILDLNKKIDKILYINDMEIRKVGAEQNNKKSYYALKDKYKKISKIKKSLEKMILIIDSYQEQECFESIEKKSKKI